MGEVLSYLREIIYHLSPKKTQYLAKLSPLWKEILSSPEEDWASKYLSIRNTPTICKNHPITYQLYNGPLYMGPVDFITPKNSIKSWLSNGPTPIKFYSAIAEL